MLSLHITRISPALFLLNYPKNFLLPLSSMFHRVWVIGSLEVILRLYKVIYCRINTSSVWNHRLNMEHSEILLFWIWNQFRELKPGWLRWSQESDPDTNLFPENRNRGFFFSLNTKWLISKRIQSLFFVVGVTTFQRVFWNSHSIVLNLRVLQF